MAARLEAAAAASSGLGGSREQRAGGGIAPAVVYGVIDPVCGVRRGAGSQTGATVILEGRSV